MPISQKYHLFRPHDQPHEDEFAILRITGTSAQVDEILTTLRHEGWLATLDDD